MELNFGDLTGILKDPEQRGACFVYRLSLRLSLELSTVLSFQVCEFMSAIGTADLEDQWRTVMKATKGLVTHGFSVKPFLFYLLGFFHYYAFEYKWRLRAVCVLWVQPMIGIAAETTTSIEDGRR